MSIERDETEKTAFGYTIDEFSSIKARKVFGMLCYLKKKRLDALVFRWNCVFRTQVTHHIDVVH